MSKNSSRFPSQVWQDMYKWENNEKSLFSDDSCCLLLNFSRACRFKGIIDKFYLSNKSFSDKGVILLLSVSLEATHLGVRC